MNRNQQKFTLQSSLGSRWENSTEQY